MSSWWWVLGELDGVESLDEINFQMSLISKAGNNWEFSIRSNDLPTLEGTCTSLCLLQPVMV